MSIAFILLAILFSLSALLLVIVVMVQPHYSESGLAGAFGGGGSDSFFGTKAMSAATKITVVLAIIFIFLAVVLNKIPRTRTEGGLMSKEASTQPVATPNNPPADNKPAETPSEQPK